MRMKYKLKDIRTCSRCGDQVSFSQYSALYNRFCTPEPSVVSFLKISGPIRGFRFINGVNLKKIWRDQSKDVYCPLCLIDYNAAISTPRNCFKCKAEINLLEAVWTRANKGYTYDEVVNFWLNPIIEFFCCKCFKEAKKEL